MDKRIPITVQGAEKLRAELDELKRVKRPAVVAAIAEAREKGDLSENAEYDAAKAEQSQAEGEILEIESKLKNAKIIEDSVSRRNEVKLGSVVTLEGEGKVRQYQIVGTTEADPFVKPIRISNESPIGMAVVGKKKGDTVSVTLPQGNVAKYVIKDISR